MRDVQDLSNYSTTTQVVTVLTHFVFLETYFMKIKSFDLLTHHYIPFFER